jgi:hypothetical protein
MGGSFGNVRLVTHWIIPPILISICLLFGCGPVKKYPGPKLPKNEIAVLLLDHTCIRFLSKIPNNRNVFGEEYCTRDDSELLPGVYEISVALSEAHWSSLENIVLIFEAKPGHTYVVKREIINAPRFPYGGAKARWRAWVEDITK